MRSLYIAIVGAAAILITPAAALAQQAAASPTRAQVRAELARIEQAGYLPSRDQASYPDRLQAAQRRLQERTGAAAPLSLERPAGS